VQDPWSLYWAWGGVFVIEAPHIATVDLLLVLMCCWYWCAEQKLWFSSRV